MVENNGVPLAARTRMPIAAAAGSFSAAQPMRSVARHLRHAHDRPQQSLETDAISVYDPMGLSAAFSLIGSAGGAAAGFGTTEPTRWDNSAKYLYQYGPVHAAAAYSTGGEGTAMIGGGYGFNAGAAYRGFSIDAVYAIEKSIVSTSPIGYGISGVLGTCNATGVGGEMPPGGQFPRRHRHG